MKTSHDPRHLKRVSVMRDLFSWGFREDKSPETEQGSKIINYLPQIDEEVKKAAPSWPIEKINRIDLAILRLAIFELIILRDTPYKVIIDEAVELAKEYGADTSPGFINGVLGKVVEEHSLEKEEK